MTGECKKYFRKISEYLDGELSEEVCRRIEEHLRRCPECIACLETFKKSIELCRKVGSEKAEVPPGFRERLRASLKKCMERR